MCFIAAARFSVLLLFCLLIASTASAEGAHAGIDEYRGAETCLACHQQEGEDFVTSVHNTWMGEATHVVGKEGEPTGKLVGINDFCISVKSNEALCGKCHAGYGLPEYDFSVEKIDCLICHAPNYKKTASCPDPSIDATAAARNVGPPTREMCLRCHALASGGDNNKRGNLELAMGAADVPRDLDVHMSANMACQDCHTFVNHHVSGRGMDLRVDDTDVPVTCNDKRCHGREPHAEGSMYNKHTDRLYCTACHVTAYGKVQTVELSRDWEDTHLGKGNLYQLTTVRESNPAPIHVWWNRMSEIVDLADPVVRGDDGAVMMAKPVGEIGDPASKIYAARFHRGRQSWDGTYLLPYRHQTVKETGNMTQAIFVATGKIYDPVQYVDTARYLGLFHGVSPKGDALTCKDCHEDHVIDFEALGYDVEKDASGNLISATKPGESLNLADFDAKAGTETEAAEGSDESTAATPGFGIIPALGGLMAVAYLLRRRN
jgi:hypothetical protein